MVTDPQGAPFYLMNPIPPEGEPDARQRRLLVDQAQHVRWNELSTHRPGAARSTSTTRRFGWTQEGDMHMGEMGEYRFFQHDGVEIGAVMPTHARHAASHVELSTSASTTSTGRPKRSRSGGGQVVNGPMEIPAANLPSSSVRTRRARGSAWSARESLKEREMAATSSPPACGSTRARRARPRNSTRPYFPDSQRRAGA